MKILSLFSSFILALIMISEISNAAPDSTLVPSLVQSLAPSALPSPVPAPETRAIEVSFFGGLTGFDEGAYRALKSSVAALLAEGIIDQFKTTFWGREGGSSFCVELSRDSKIGIEQVTQMLGAIHPRDNSVYKYVLVEKCQ